MVIRIEYWWRLTRVSDGLGWRKGWLIVPLPSLLAFVRNPSHHIIPTVSVKLPCSPQTEGVGVLPVDMLVVVLVNVVKRVVETAWVVNKDAFRL